MEFSDFISLRMIKFGIFLSKLGQSFLKNCRVWDGVSRFYRFVKS